MRRILKKQFFDRPTLKVAEDMLGKYLVCEIRGKERACKITEVEGYDGHKDRASHAHKGKTERTEVMFDEAGVLYVYLVYGMYDMLNVVTGAEEYPAAVLIRGVELDGKKINGPGKLTKILGITRKKFNRKPASKKSGLWFEDRGERVNKKDIKKTPRIGVNYAGPVWAGKPWRFVLEQ